jgi:hypothetical protein
LAQIILGRRKFKIVQMKGDAPLQGEIIAKEQKCTEFFFKIFFSRTTDPEELICRFRIVHIMVPGGRMGPQ